MPLGQGIGELWEALRDRIEVSGTGPTWEVTAGSFDGALAYARQRFGEPVVLARRDRDRWWPRVTLTVTTDPALAASAPSLEAMARPQVPTQPVSRQVDATVDHPQVDHHPDDHVRDSRVDPAIGFEDARVDSDEGMPSALEAIFDHQEQLRIARQRVPDHDR